MEKEDLKTFYSILNRMIEEDKTYQYSESIDITDTKTYVNHAKKVKTATVTGQLLLACHSGDKLYQTILFYRNGIVNITKETLNQVLKNTYTTTGINYDNYKRIVQKIYAQKMYKIPYVYKDIALIPVHKTYKDDIVWINSLNIKDFETIEDKLKIEFIDNSYIYLLISEEIFEKQIQKAQQLFLLQYKHFNEDHKKYKNITKNSILLKNIEKDNPYKQDMFSFLLQQAKILTKYSEK